MQHVAKHSSENIKGKCLKNSVKWSASSTIKEIQIQTTLRYYSQNGYNEKDK